MSRMFLHAPRERGLRLQDEEAFGSPSVFLVMNPLILAILSVLAILLPFYAD